MSTTPISGGITSIVSVISSLLLLYSGVLAGADLGNHTKQFTPNYEMSTADWSSPENVGCGQAIMWIRGRTYPNKVHQVETDVLPIPK